jgi:chemotaxis protein methyltransferase CheR
MRDAECVQLLQWALPKLGLRWAGYRRVKRQVCRRVRPRFQGLGCADARAYAAHLERAPSEWAVLEGLCGVTISRFSRDRAVFECLARQVMPALAHELADGELRVSSAGCASGEEPHTIALIWEQRFAADHPGRALRVLATDRDSQLLARAAASCYRARTTSSGSRCDSPWRACAPRPCT